ncbi:copper amine oxidase N-terminal domain-containing protein [Tumebacillus permanentifrigoris]|uniref:Copper amine oxidase-like protein n=1 Tax=Tumebacillus permanentifrigoris TaxID=378543 RepID=A0A316DYX6_9BACL|nr:copper amine oxidase N-terminal domain-containing protein [Tumebacillus permanentifrigoris]PWK15700.1 copper amine oxidase-like protein [Tumebacillus permanentifrigoris]
MKKTTAFVLSGALLCVLATTAFASDPLKLFVNGKEVSNQPLQMLDGSTYGPVRAIAEALGAKVTWNGAEQKVQIDAPESKPLQLQIEELERALAAGSPEVAAQTWAHGVKERNGAEQYAVLSPELRAKMKDEFAQAYWVTGTSSPAVESYQLTHEKRIDDNTYTYNIEFSYATSTGPAGQEVRAVTVKREGTHWFLTQLGGEPTTQPQAVDQKVTLKDGTTLKAPGDAQLSAKVQLRIDTLGVVKSDDADSAYAGVVGNHAELKAQELVELPTGHAKLLTIERTMPAGMNDDSVLHEYWLVILGPYAGRDDMQSAYTLSAVYANADADGPTVKAQLLELAKQWVVSIN